MSNTKHTPGPWRLQPTKFPYTSNIILGNGKKIAVASMTKSDSLSKLTEWPLLHCDRDKEQIEANAKLIAAAPEMLEALKLVAEYHEHDVAWSEYGDKIKSAIKKATE